jgi:predicted MFS family arabinose efflux permease
MLNYSISLYKNAYAGLSKPVWWLAVVMLVNRAGTMVIPFLTLYLRDEKNFTIVQAGWEVAFFGIGAILGNFIGGRLTDKHGFYHVQFWSLFLNGILFIILGQMQTFWQIGICMFVIGSVGEGFRPANAAAIAYYSLPENRTRSYSLNRLAINLGFSVGPAVGGFIAFKYLFWVDGITCILAALILRAALPEVKTGSLNKEKTGQSEKPLSVWRDAVYLKFMFFVFLSALCFLQVFSMLPPFYTEQMHFSKALAGVLLALNGLVIAIFEMVLVYKLEGRRSPVQYISLGTFFIGLSYVLLNLPFAALPVALFSMLVITLGEMLMFPFVNTFWISRSNQQNRGQYASVYSMSFATAHVLAPTFGSQLIHYTSYDTLWWVVFALCAVAALGFSTFKKHHTD